MSTKIITGIIKSSIIVISIVIKFNCYVYIIYTTSYLVCRKKRESNTQQRIEKAKQYANIC